MSEPFPQRRLDLALLAETAVERAARVTELQATIARHAYDIPPIEVADAVVAFFHRDLPPLASADDEPSGKSC